MHPHSITRRSLLQYATTGLAALGVPSPLRALNLPSAAADLASQQPALPCLRAASHPYPPPLEAIIAKLDPASDVFPTEVYAAQLESLLNDWSKALEVGTDAAGHISAWIADSAQHASFTPSSSTPSGNKTPIAVERLTFAPPANTGAASFRKDIAAFFEGFRSVDVADFEIYGIRTLANGAETRASAIHVETQVHYNLAGTTVEGRRQQNGSWTIAWTKADEAWKVSRWSIGPATRSSLPGLGFVDVTTECLDPHQPAMRQLQPGIDHWRTVLDAAIGVDVYGNHGIAAGAIDDSGLDSFYVCQPSGLPNRLFQNRGDGTFDDITEVSGTGLLDGTASAIFADFENRGKQDLLVVRSGGPMLFRNLGGGRFEPRPDAFHFATPPQGTFTSAAVADYNCDGHLDVYLCVYSYYQGLNQYQFPTPYYDAQNGPPNFLFRNRGDGTFEDVTAASGMNENNNRFSFAAEWVDLHGTGLPDLMVANDFGRKNLYRNQGNGSFRDLAAARGVEDYGPGMSVCAMDADGDGALDLYIANMWLAEGKRITEQKEFLPDVPEAIRALYRKHNAGNSLFHNSGNGSFAAIGEQAGVARGGWSWSCAAWDMTHMGQPDLYVANGFVSGTRTPDLQSFFWRQIAQRSLGKATPGEYEQAWNAVNELLRSDYSWSGHQRNVMYRNAGDGSFDDVSSVVGLDLLDDSRAFALADIDGDGRLEILLKNRTGPQLRVLRNAIADLGQVISIHLQGTRSNRDGIGALVTVAVDGKRQVRQLSAGSGFASQHSKELFFGLGKHAGAISVSVQWPSGAVGTWTGISPGTRNLLREGSPTAESTDFRVRSNRAASAAPAAPALPADTVVSTWLVAPLYGPAFRLTSALDGSAVDLQSLPGNYIAVVLVDLACTALTQWLQSLSAARSSLEQFHLSVAIVTPDTQDRSSLQAFARSIQLRTLCADAQTMDAWSIQLRYLFDRRRDLTYPTTLFMNRAGAVVRIHQGKIVASTLLDDMHSLDQTGISAMQRALPFPGPYYGNPMQRDDFTIGVAFVQYGLLDEAQAAFQRAVSNRPTYAAGWFNLGTVYLNKKQYADAEKCLQQAVTLDSSDSDAWNNLGLVQGEQGKYDAALESFRNAALASPDAIMAVENMMRIYQYQGRAAEAQQALSQLLARSPNQPELHLAMGMTRLALQDAEGGEAELKRAIALRPDYVDARNDLGKLYVQQGKYSLALEQFDRCRAIDPQFDRAVLNEAVVYSRVGRAGDARKLLRDFLQTQPGNTDVANLLQRLGGP